MSSGKRGLRRIQELQAELGRIRAKLEHARENGVPERDVEDLVEGLPHLDRTVGEAAVAEAKREADRLAAEAQRIHEGRKRAGGNHPGNQDDEPDDMAEDDDDSGDGNGGGDGGEGDGDGEEEKKSYCCCCCCCYYKKKDPPMPASGSSVPDATCVYVQSATLVAAWSRPIQDWLVFDAQSEIVEVTFVTGGILAVGKQRAALFDCKLGIWLKAYESPEELLDGAGK